MSFRSAFADDYSDGLVAYIEGDYVQAQVFWLAAAGSGDAKSMFNLGLLNEQSKLVTSTNEKAEEWYRKSAMIGYSAAAYHLAQRLLERGGSDDQAMALIQQAADQHYAPAVRYLGDSIQPQEKKSFLKKIDSSPTNDYQAEAWINSQKGNNWTIQLLAFTHESKVQAFIVEHKLQSKAAYFVEKKAGVVWYKLIYGSFDSKDKATFARQNLSSRLREYGPWLRTITSVQAITKD